MAGLTAAGFMLLAHAADAELINITQQGYFGGIIPKVGGEIAAANNSQGEHQMFEWLYDQWEAYDDETLNAPTEELLANGTKLKDLDFSVPEYVGHYLVIHWGLGQAGQLFQKGQKPSGGFNQAFYIASGGVFDLPVPVLQDASGKTKPVGGLSYWRIYTPPPQDGPPTNNVPDTGSTLALLSFVCGLLFLGARRVNQTQRSLKTPRAR